MQVEHVCACQNILGEGPIWSGKEQCLYWVDILGKKVQRFNPKTKQYDSFDVPLQVSLLAFRNQGGFICGTEDGIYTWEIGADEMKCIANPEKGKAGARFNDGKVDRGGRLWAGTMMAEGATSALYRLDPDMKLTEMLGRVTISNGIGWSPDNATMYYVDSLRFVINAFDFDLDTGEISNQRPFVQLNPEIGVPDGLTVDREGTIWCAIYDGWKVLRFSPTGEISGEIKMPVARPSSVMFGGQDLDELFITSIAEGLSSAEKEQQPIAGDLFMVKTEVKGLPEPFFAG